MSGVQSVSRAFAILQSLAGGPAGLSEIAARTDLPKSTVARLLATLQELGAVGQDDTGGEYRMGALVTELAGSVSPTRNLANLAHQSLVELVEDLEEAAGLAVLDETGQVLYLDQVDADHDIQIRDWTGEYLPFHCVSSGLVLMAGAAPALLRQATSSPLPRYTSQTVSDATEILERVDEARCSGVAWTTNELADDITSVAAPIVDPTRTVVAAVHVHGPSYRFPGDRRRDEIEKIVTEAANRISTLLSH
ncbi:MAG: IclR family transcriptional regulator [Actinomycetia bacterium]|nr:IclR family transcriptional regulator [Actinomycetes bacterium]